MCILCTNMLFQEQQARHYPSFWPSSGLEAEGVCTPLQESEASCRMLRELCLRSGVLVPPELMQSSSSLAGSTSLQVLLTGTAPC